jgi:hypothetical protein
MIDLRDNVCINVNMTIKTKYEDRYTREGINIPALAYPLAYLLSQIKLLFKQNEEKLREMIEESC